MSLSKYSRKLLSDRRICLKNSELEELIILYIYSVNTHDRNAVSSYRRPFELLISLLNTLLVNGHWSVCLEKSLILAPVSAVVLTEAVLSSSRTG